MAQRKKSSLLKKIEITFQREIPLLKYFSNKYFWIIIGICLIFIALMSFLIYFCLQSLTKPLFEIFNSNFGIGAVGEFFAVFVLCGLIFLSVYFLKVMFSSIEEIKKEKNIKPFLTISIIITLLLTGTVFIHSVVGAPNTEWKLFKNQTYVSSLSCKDIQGRLIEEHRIYCEVKNKEVNITNWDIFVELHNGTQLEYNSFTFVAPKNVNHMMIRINAVENNLSLQLSTGFYPKFYSIESEKERQKDFLTYFFGLLFICLITIPPLVYKLFDKVIKNEERSTTKMKELKK